MILTKATPKGEGRREGGDARCFVQQSSLGYDEIHKIF